MPPFSLLEEMASLESAVLDNQFDGYGLLPIPHALDGRIEAFLETYASASQDERVFFRCLPTRTAGVLLAFVERHAATSVRTHSPDHLAQSLLALGLAFELEEAVREAMLVMPLPWHAAIEIGIAPRDAYGQAAACIPQTGKQALLAFCERAPEDQTLASMGFAVGSDAGGFRFVRTW